MSNWIMGIDGGGSKTVARLAQMDGRGGVAQVATGRAGASNLANEAPTKVAQSLSEAIDEAWNAAGVPRQKFAGMVLCMAGAGSAPRRAELLAWVSAQGLADRALVVPDVCAVLAGAVPAGPGLALVVGTGSIAIGRRADGSLVRAGGWGPVLGDEGGGYWLGLMAIKATLTTLECGLVVDGSSSTLVTRVLAAFGCRDAPTLLAALHGSPTQRAQISALAPIVLEESDSDPAAHAIVLDATCALADLVVRVTDQLYALLPGKRDAPAGATSLPVEGEPLAWAVAGSVCVRNPSLVTDIHRVCWARGVYLERPHIVADPSVGAVQLAYRLVHERPLGTDLSAFQ